MQRLVLCSAILASSLIFAAVSIAQSPSPCFVFASGIRIYDKANVKPPFSATIQTTYEQKLADGNSIHGILITHEYRDTSGRIRTESSMRCVLGLDGQFHPDLRISVWNLAGTTIWWGVNGAHAGQVLSVDHDAAAVEALKAGKYPQGRRLAATGWAQKGDELSPLDGEREAVKGTCLPEDPDEPVKLNLCTRDREVLQETVNHR